MAKPMYAYKIIKADRVNSNNPRQISAKLRLSLNIFSELMRKVERVKIYLYVW